MHNMKDLIHYSDVMMDTIASQITILPIVYSTVYSGADQLKHPSSASLVFVPGIQRWPVNSPHKGPVTRKMFPFDDAIMIRPYDTGHVTRNLPAIMFFMLRKRSAEATNLIKNTIVQSNLISGVYINMWKPNNVVWLVQRRIEQNYAYPHLPAPIFVSGENNVWNAYESP